LLFSFDCNFYTFPYFFVENGLEAEMTELLKKHPNANFFCDEVPIGIDGISEEFLIDYSSKVSKDCFLWIAGNSSSTSSSTLKNSGNSKF